MVGKDLFDHELRSSVWIRGLAGRRRFFDWYL